jgi:hypothetical protein
LLAGDLPCIFPGGDADDVGRCPRSCLKFRPSPHHIRKAAGMGDKAPKDKAKKDKIKAAKSAAATPGKK